MTKYFVDPHGIYLGGFDGAEPPLGAIEVPYAPEYASYVWDGEKFSQPILTNEEFNAPILARLSDIEKEAAALRAQLRK